MKISKAMQRELRSIAWDGNPTDPSDWDHAPESLWFVTRDRVIGALLKRGLIWDDPNRSGYSLTDAGQAVLRDIEQEAVVSTSKLAPRG